MDWLGAASLAAALFFLMLFLSRLEQASVSPVMAVVYGLVFVGATTAFIVRESRCQRPLLDLRVFRTRAFLMPLLAMMLFFVSSFMINVVGPFYFEGVMGFRPTQVGLLFLVVPLVMVVASPVSGWLFDKRHWGHYATVGIAAVALCYIALGILARSWYNVPAMAGVFFLLGLGSALFQSPNSTEVMNALPRSETAIASSISAVSRNLGMTLGVALASLLLPLQLRFFGNAGGVLEASKGALAASVGNIMLVAGAFCLITVAILLRSRAPVAGRPERRPT
jgi:predicted MFS family arabinose efflux permease